MTGCRALCRVVQPLPCGIFKMLHYSTHTDYNADSTECCPAAGLRHVLAVGTYELDEATQQRLGRLHLYTLQSQPHSASTEQQGDLQWSLQHETCLDVPGIFDLKWQHTQGSTHTDTAVLGAALADGTVRLLHVSEQQTQDDGTAPEVTLAESTSCQAVSDGMALSLDWQHCAGADTGLLAASGNTGSAALLQLRESGVEPLAEWTAHDLEVWCAAFDRCQPSVLYTGSDDCCFKTWDVRMQGSGDTADPTCMHTNRKTHTAGVCTISPHPLVEHVVATGSYDERVRLWDARNPARPLLTAEVSTGGGNWRLRWHPTHRHLLLAACMYNGFAVLCSASDYSSLRLEEAYQGHASIAYGADWFRHEQESDKGNTTHQDLVATCSFYDKLLHVWSPTTASVQPVT